MIKNYSKPYLIIMELQSYIEKYNDEDICIEKLKNMRLQCGLVCHKCSHERHSFRKIDLKFQCKNCGNRISLRSGTIMENSNLPIKYWMICIELMTLSQKKISILEIQYLLQHKRYEPIWLMVRKIRMAMQIRDQKYSLRPYTDFDLEFLKKMDKISKFKLKTDR